MASSGPTVAVIGASGIGKHHAKWWDFAGARVVAFLGTTPESVAQTRKMLGELFGFDGRGYTDLAELLDREEPCIVDVCSPPDCHFSHVLAAIEAGCDVLCEKPFVFDCDLSADAILDGARELVTRAEREGTQLGMCSQYHVSARQCMELLGDHTGETSLKRYRGHQASPVRGRKPDPHATWVDLSPHMLAGVQALVPDGRLDSDDLRTAFSGYEARAEFTVKAPDRRTVECEIITARTRPEDDHTHVRRFDLNGHRFDIGAGTDEEGIYCAQIGTEWGTFQRPDMLRMLIREFMAGENPIDGPTALANLRWMLRMASPGKGTSP